MRPRRMLVTTAVAVAMLAAGGADAATKHSLDGRRTRTAKYAGSLDVPTIPFQATDPTTPALADCTPESCDVRELHLMLPRSSTSGRLHATVVVEFTLEATLVLYNAEGQVLQQHDWFNGTQDGEGSYRLDVHVERLSRGLYTLALVDRAGTGKFAATVAWVAHPPPTFR